MVGVINPNSTQTLDAQIDAAKHAKLELAPGEKMPDEGAPTPYVISTPSAVPHSNSGVHKLSTGAVVGISLGGAAFLAICAALFFFIGRSKTLKEAIHKPDQGTMTKPVGVGGPEMGQAQMLPQSPQTPYSLPQSPQSPQSPYSPVYGQAQADFASPLPPYASPQPHAAQLNMAGGFYAPNSQQSYRQVIRTLTF